MNKNIVIGGLALLLVLVVGYVVVMSDQFSYFAADEVPATSTPVAAVPPPVVATSTATSTMVVDESRTAIGMSAGGQPIMAYHFGQGETELLFVGGIHGGYAWNTTLVAYELMSYLEANPTRIPRNVKVTVIPVLNPDGLLAVVGTTSRFSVASVPLEAKDTVVGRFNAHQVDLNRNFDCEWQASGTWQNQTVSGGTAPFSEPEAVAIREYVKSHTIASAVVWYSAAGGVFASNCKNGVSEKTKALTALYATAAKYPAKADFNFYEITGDMVNWLAKENIPAISVLLTTHKDTDWSKNQAGVEALLASYAE